MPPGSKALSAEAMKPAIVRCEGNLRRAAAQCNVTRDHFARLVKQYELWPLVNEARANKVKGTNSNELIGRARSVLKG
jgi:hypothetical protein